MKEQFIDQPRIFERTIKKLQGPLACAIAGSQNQKPACALFMGSKDVVGKGARILALVSWLQNHLYFPTWPLLQWAYGKKIYGNLLTSMLFTFKGKQGKLVIKAQEKLLQSVILLRKDDENIEFTWQKQNGDIIINQVLHFGKKLANGDDRLTVEYKYCPEKGELRTNGPLSVDEANFTRENIVLTEHRLTQKMFDSFERLSGHAAGKSVTFPANCGILLPALEQLSNPDLGVDFHRVAVYALDFCNTSDFSPKAEDIIHTTIEPQSVIQTDKGQLLAATLSIKKQDQEFNRSTFTLMVRGNTGDQKLQVIERIVYRNLASSGQNLSIEFMQDKEVIEFVELNGDYNPLHQIDGVAQAVGFRKIIVPGCGILAQIESAVIAHFSQALKQITGTFIRPVYPGQKCSLEFAGENEQYDYQLINKENKVLVDGRIQF